VICSNARMLHKFRHFDRVLAKISLVSCFLLLEFHALNRLNYIRF
jgi:hypothetical protein